MTRKAIAACLVLGLTASALPFSAFAATNPTTPTSTEATSEKTTPTNNTADATPSAQNIGAQQTDFTVTADTEGKAGMVTIGVTAKKAGSFILRRAGKNGAWANVGVPQTLAADASYKWTNVAQNDVDATAYAYQVVALTADGVNSQATTLRRGSAGKYTSTVETVTMSVPKKPGDPGDAAKPDDGKPPVPKDPDKKDPDKQDPGKTDPDKKEPDKKDPDKKDPDKKEPATTVTKTPVKAQPKKTVAPVKKASTTTVRPSSTTAKKTTTTKSPKKTVPKTGAVGIGVEGALALCLLGAGTGAVVYTRRRK